MNLRKTFADLLDLATIAGAMLAVAAVLVAKAVILPWRIGGLFTIYSIDAWAR